MNYDSIKSHFKIKEDQGDSCKAICPAHPDKEASLSIKYDDKEHKTLFYCHAGCETPDIVAAVGLKVSDLFDFEQAPETSKGGKKIVNEYMYRDIQGNVLFEKVRFEPKNFTQKRLIDGATIWGLDGGIYYETFKGSNAWSKKKRDNVATKEFPVCEPVIYNLPEVIQAVKDGKPVFIVEGEKDADNLKKWDLTATCNFDGASSSNKKPKWRKEYNQYFRGAKVIILHDNDDSGIAHRDNIAANLIDEAENIKCPELPGLEEKQDVSDWIEAGHTKEDLMTLIELTDTYDVEGVSNQSLIKFNFSDVGNAERLVAMFGKNIRYNPIRKKWFIWSGKYWEVDTSGKIETMARKVIRKLQQEGIELPSCEENTKLKERISQYVLRSESDAKIKAMINQAKTQNALIIKETDKNGYQLNLLNGTLNLKTGLLEKHNRKDFITRIVNIEYEPQTQCPNWIEFINKIFLDNKELINYIQKSIGYSITGDADLQCFYILHGRGSNGKGTFIKTVMTLLGDYAGLLKGNSLMEKMGDEGARGDLAKLQNKYFVCVNELEEGRSFDEALVKSLSSGSGEAIPVRRMYEEEFDLHPTFKMWMTTNKLPKVKGTDEGIWRRIRKIPFEYSFENDENKNEKFFEELLLPEISGVLNWALEGCLKWQQEGMKLPEIVKFAIDDYRSDMDPVQRFLSEECIISETCKAPISRLYEIYSDWCHENKEYVLSSIKFSKKLSEKGFKQSKSMNTRYWEHIGIVDSEHQLGFTECKDNFIPFN